MKKQLKSIVIGATLFCSAPAMAQHWDPNQYPFDLIAPYLIQAGRLDVVTQNLKTRGEYDMTADYWSALWIKVPNAKDKDFGVYKFRKDITLNTVPKEFVVYVSGDERYKLFVNGTVVSLGPARSDASHWRYETVNLAPYLKPGKNVVAALVHNEGSGKALSNASIRTGFMMMGKGEAAVLTTDQSWKCLEDKSVTPLPVTVSGYYALGPAEKVVLADQISDWLSPDADLSTWQDAQPYDLVFPHDTSSGTGGYSDKHLMLPSPLPQMELKETRLQSIRKDGGLKIPAGFPKTKADLTIPANKSIDLLLDNEVLTNAYFHLLFSKGKNAQIGITYAESLYADDQYNNKGNRNEVEGKILYGKTDQLISSGAQNQEFVSLEFRTYRYVNLHIVTGDEALTLNDIGGTFVGYPFELKASLNTDNQELQKILEIGWRTARLCAFETYVDCPYYEQLQYLGDTRIQALISYFNAGDDRLAKNFLRQSDLSRNAEGITTGRAPSDSSPQYITPYALSYIYAIHDYLMYGTDRELIEDLLPGMEQILNYFHRYQKNGARLKNLPGWNFSDWVNNHEGWTQGVAARGADGSSSLMDLQLLLGYQMASMLEKEFGRKEQSELYDKRAAELKKDIHAAYWNEERGLYSDRAEQDRFSQHANSLAILCGMDNEATQKEIGRKLTTDSSLAPCSLYYRFYLIQALIEAGYGNDLLDWLGPWKENMALGLTTWAEDLNPETSRSDCHAWGATPNIEFYRTLLGIDSASPAFSTVKIEPHLGTLKEIGGTMPHPKGQITVAYKVNGNKIKASIELPAGVTGNFIWKGKTTPIKGGKNEINL